MNYFDSMSETLLSVIGVLWFGAVLLIALWVERQTPEEKRREELRRRLCAHQDRDIELDGEGSPVYNIYSGAKCVFGTDNEQIALEEFGRECSHTTNEVRLFRYGEVIEYREALS